MSDFHQRQHGELNAREESPSPRQRKQQRGETPDALSIATIAAQLIPPGARDSHDLRMVSEAVALATRIVEQASKKPMLRAYELFHRDAKLSTKEIAETFAEHDWPKLRAQNSVIELVRALLEAMHRDIQSRRALVATVFRKRSLRIDPAEVEQEASAGVKALLQNLGMDFMNAQTLDDVTGHVWHNLVEAWLLDERSLRDEFAKKSFASEALFSAICGNSSYAEFIKSQRPPESLNPEGLLAVTLWMTNNLRKYLDNRETRDDFVDQLFWLNLWPEFYFPRDRHISQPFAEYLDALKTDSIEQKTLTEKFDSGIQRFTRFLGRFMLAEFSKQFATEPFFQCLDGLKKAWTDQGEAEKESLSELFEVDPLQNINSILSFSRGELPRFTVRLPFDGMGVELPILRSYAQRLDLLRNSLGEASYLASHLNVQDSLHNAEGSVHAEKTRIIEMNEELKDMESESNQEKIATGERLVRPLESKFPLGKINAHLLFRYAAERGLMEDRLVKA